MTLDPILSAKYAALKKDMERLKAGVQSVVDNRLGNYTDKQYGKGELKALLSENVEGTQH